MKTLLFLFFPSLFFAQKFTQQDSLMGSNTPERAWWNVEKYEISVEPDFDSKTIKGSSKIYFSVLSEQKRIQIDLQNPLVIDSVIFEGKKLKATRLGDIYYIDFESKLNENRNHNIYIYYSGTPKEAKNPPWDGGWIWGRDKLGRPWMSVACQGIGASSWFPCKDYGADEPEDGSELTMTISTFLQAVSNGKRLSSFEQQNHKKAVTWKVKNPINSYNIIPNIGHYVNWTENYSGEKGELTCSYWVLDYEFEKAKEQFKQVKNMLQSFENWFGPYPFYEDTYKLIQSPYLGMEHQSGIAYGNGFQNGYYGKDLSSSGWGLKWDFIIVHESGHEWFGNNISSKDVADMWIHESFTNYSETLFTESFYGKQAGNEYVIGLRKNIKNDRPIIGKYDVRNEGSGDMYYKGANMIHTIRQIIQNDEKFRLLLRGLNKDFYHKTVTTEQIETYISNFTGINFSKIFDQYLRTNKLPILEYKVKKGQLYYRWSNCVEQFDMKVKISNSDFIEPRTEWKNGGNWNKKQKLLLDPNFYVDLKKVRLMRNKKHS
ncbi:MAG: M1 family metallopeptidase [Bacteroidota bacterium]